MPDNRKPIPPNPPRWQPNPDPMSIEIPGLDTSASPHEQIEQIEQLITLKLQNIDENFSKVHHVLSTRILPAVKRYAVGTEPVREAAKFWVSFYERAAQIRIPTFEDYASVNEEPSEPPGEPNSSHVETSSSAGDEERDENQSLAVTESSFAPGEGAFFSTPAADRIAHSSHLSDDASWSASLESPIVRLDREIKNFAQDANETESSIAPTPSKPPPSSRSQRSIDKGKAREQPEPLLKSILRHSIYTSPSKPSVSPLRPKGKTPILKNMNPFLPQGANPSKWNGIVDLQDASINSPQHSKRFREPLSQRKPTTPAKFQDYDSDDDSFVDPLLDMSPPVLVSPIRPIKASVKLGQTPGKAAAARIAKDIVADVRSRKSGRIHAPFGSGSIKPNLDRGIFRGALESDSSMSSISTLPSLSKYNFSTSSGTDSSLESLMRQVGLKDPLPGQQPTRHNSRYYEYSSANEASTSASVFAPKSSGHALDVHGGAGSSDDNDANAQTVRVAGAQNDPGPSANVDQTENHGFLTPTPHQFQPPYFADDDDDDDDEDSDIINNTAHPSAAFLMMSQNRRPLGDDDLSFDDDDDSMVQGDDSFDQNVVVGEGAAGGGELNMMIPVHPFARAGMSIEDDGFDDSFDNDVGAGNNAGMMSEETLFGVPPAEREQRLGPSASAGALMMRGGDLLDTSQLTEDIAKTAESPTPAPSGWNRR